MSLNGLNGAAVVEAHQAAQADAGGWFLLKYANRDTIELLGRGTGGVPEVRAAVEKYEEKSPLYGMVQYRRKKVILKYVPEGTSRLLQVRLTVQFQSVLETFIPHDTVFSFNTASELTESGLGLSAMLIPSAASLTSSSSSLRRRRLNEISEDVEDITVTGEGESEERSDLEKSRSGLGLSFVPKPAENALPLTPNSTAAFGRHELDELPASAVLAKALLAKRKEEAAAALMDLPNSDAESTQEKVLHPPRKESLLSSPKLSGSPLPSPLQSVVTNKSLPATPEPTPPSTSEGQGPRAQDFETTSNILLEATTAAAAGASSPPTPRPPHTRHLSAAESDSISQWSNNVASYATVKAKKKKLGPRPHVESTTRPKTSGTTETSTGIRPVANLPTSIRVSNKSLASTGLRPGSQQSTRSVPIRFASSSQSVNGVPPLPSPAFLQQPYSPSDTRSAGLRTASVTGDATAATPEKLRLMKALQLRKRNMLLAQRASTSPSIPTIAHQQNLSESSVSTCLSSIPGQELLTNIDEDSKLTQSFYTASPTIATHISEDPSTKASSFSEQEDPYHSRRSLSSATSSSLTPKALAQHPENTTATDRAAEGIAANSSSTVSVLENKTIPDDDLKAVLKYLDTTPETHQKASALDTTAADTVETAQRVQTAATFSRPPAAGSSRRLEPPAHLKLLPSASASASELSEDDSLMDEIHNATVHEAKPMSVARTPVTPVMSKRSSDRLREAAFKPSTTSQSVGKQSTNTTPERGRSANGSVRSISTALPQWPPLPTPPSSQVPLTKKATLGTGISKRIKALEGLRIKDSSPPRSPQTIRETNSGTTAFSTFMKRSSFLMNQPPMPNAPTETSPPKALPSTGAQYDSHAWPAAEQRAPSVDDQKSTHRGETISVTARIIRDQNSKRPPVAPSSSYHTPLNLYRSPLIVEKHEQSASESAIATPARVQSPTKSERGRFSFSSHRSQSHPNLPRSDSNITKASKSGSHKRHGPRSNSDAASVIEDKAKSSMTSRLMKRMSNLTGSRSKTQAPVKQEPDGPQSNATQHHAEPTRKDSMTESLLHVVDIGDVNVQFPESFLWKRRFMRIDDQGYLIFSPPASDRNVKTSSRKYHLGDFKRPSLPDHEREEMAWSILLDLKDGRCIQCACESRQSQQQVLQMLVDAHSAYHQLYVGSVR